MSREPLTRVTWGQAQIDQAVEPFDALVRTADDAEPLEEVRGEDVGLSGVLEPVVIGVVVLGDVGDDGCVCW
jgi:hypothetical protein